MKINKATDEEIKIFHKLRLRLNIWCTKTKGKSYSINLYDETWYGHDSKVFNYGFFVFIQLYVFAVHIKFEWLELRL